LNLPEDICDRIVLLFSFGKQMGGEYQSDGSLKIPFNHIKDLQKWSSSGIIRITSTIIDKIEYAILHFPHHFLLQYLKGRCNLLSKDLVNQLFYLMNSTTINPDTGKGYLLQLAIALEFLAPDSRLRAEIFKIIDPAIFPVRYNGLEYFESDDDLKNKLMKLPKNYIFVACDKSKTHKLGDIAFKVSKQDGTTYLVRLEVKNSTTQDYLYKGCVDFIKKTQTCDLGDYFVFLSN